VSNAAAARSSIDSDLLPPPPTSADQRDAVLAAADRLWREAERAVDGDDGFHPQAFAERVVDEMYRLVGAPCSVFRVLPTQSGWATDFFATRGLREEDLAAYRRALQTQRRDLLLHDPLFPKPDSRNVVETLSPAQVRQRSRSTLVLERLGAAASGVTRILVCDGPLLLATMNVFRAHGPRLDAQVLGQLSRPARLALRAARSISVRSLGPVLDTLLLTYPGEAYVLSESGAVEIANELGSRCIQDEDREVLRELAELAEAYPKPSPGWELQPVRARGQPLLLVALRAQTAQRDLEARLQIARSRWNLTPRHVEVLRSLALGYSNKDLARTLDMSPRTAEQHVADILVRTGSESRLQLVSRLWRDA
jgi:DNA-binding CsgD family transcriptional regulator